MKTSDNIGRSWVTMTSTNWAITYGLYNSLNDIARAVHKVDSSKERKEYHQFYKANINIRINVSSTVKKILKNVETETLKSILKKEKIEVRASKENQKAKKKIIKISKIYRYILEQDGENKFAGHLNKVEYRHQFVYPMLKDVLHDIQIKYKLGESHLQCAAAMTNDDQRAQSGPKIDIIMLHKKHNMAIGMCEVSGPNFKTNRQHYLVDRNKLAKNMRAILNHFESITSTPNMTALNNIKIYSIQIYCNTLYIYSLKSVGYGYSVFLLEKKNVDDPSVTITFKESTTSILRMVVELKQLV